MAILCIFLVFGVGGLLIRFNGGLEIELNAGYVLCCIFLALLSFKCHLRIAMVAIFVKVDYIQATVGFPSRMKS